MSSPQPQVDALGHGAGRNSMRANDEAIFTEMTMSCGEHSPTTAHPGARPVTAQTSQ